MSPASQAVLAASGAAKVPHSVPARVSLRPTEPADLPFVVAIESEAANERLVDIWAAEEHRSALAAPDLRHLTIESDNGMSVGFALLAGFDSQNGAVELKRIVIGPRDTGYGRAALRVIKQWVFEEVGAHRLWLDVKDFNRRARALYSSEGFVQEGVLRECLRGPQGFESLVVMAMLRPEYDSASLR